MKTALFATTAALALAFSIGTPAMAQEASEATQTGLDDIVVTARRVEERLQDVPVAITAFNGEALEARNVTDVQSLANVAPG